MKNIHVLPTDKPSRFFNTNKGQYNFRGHYVPDTIQTCKNHNIYITSNEEIKERNWCYHIDGEYDFPVQIKGIAPRTPTRRNVSILTSNSSQLAGGKYIKFVESCDISELKKIILTTDQELIKGGVQAIDDEFLEWFVENPSCETVEISTYHVKGDISGKLHYKIIIPQEEPTLEEEYLKDQLKKYEGINVIVLNKPEEYLGRKEDPKGGWTPTQGESIWIKVFSNWSLGTYIGWDIIKEVHIVREDEKGGGNLMSSKEVLPYFAMPNNPKKETLEEAADKWVFETNGHKWSNNDDTVGDNYGSFKAGAEWMRQQMESLKDFETWKEWKNK